MSMEYSNEKTEKNSVELLGEAVKNILCGTPSKLPVEDAGAYSKVFLAFNSFVDEIQSANISLKAEETDAESYSAPDANILVVDDSSINLMIFEDLAAPLGSKVESLDSGGKCVQSCKEKKYDIIFVDHLMPEMDGVETFHHIKEDSDSLNKETPIIILTANTDDGAKEEYMKEGFSDYLGKPMKPEKLLSMIKQYLPKELIKASLGEASEGEEKEESPIEKIKAISVLDVDSGMEFAGSEKLYLKVAAEFAETAPSRADKIETLYETMAIREYTIEVHALKSSARLVGAKDLSNLAKEMEDAGNANDMDKIEGFTSKLLADYRELAQRLSEVFAVKKDLKKISDEAISNAVDALMEMVDGFDFDSVDCIMDRLSQYLMPEKFSETYINLKTMVAEVARDDILELLNKYKESCQ